MSQITKCLSLLVGVVLTAQAGVGFCAETINITLHGSNTLGSKLAPGLLQAYARQQGFADAKVIETAPLEFAVNAVRADGSRFAGAVQAHGTNTGYADLLSGAADIWMASRAATPEEVQAAAAVGPLHTAEQEHVVALDGLAIIVHPRNPVQRLQVDQIRDAFAGRITDWAQLGGAPGPIHLYGRDHQSGTFDSFKSMVLTAGTELAASTQRFESSSELEKRVSNDPAALGFVGFSYITASRALAVMARGTPALTPDALSISTEDYLLARRLYFYTAKESSAQVRDFVEFVQSAAGQQVVAATGFVAQNIFLAQADPLPGNPPMYYDVIADAERLSLNFRFRPASATLDSRALRDIERLSQFMSQPQNRRKQVRLAAFAASVASAPIVTQLTLNDRVDYISQLLASHGVPTSMSRGFLQGAKVAPADRADGQVRNERVEVWLVDPLGGGAERML